MPACNQPHDVSDVSLYTVEWSSPPVKNRPPPCGVVTFTRISDHHAVVFGGNYQDARSDDLFILDIKNKVCDYINLSCIYKMWPLSGRAHLR